MSEGGGVKAVCIIILIMLILECVTTTTLQRTTWVTLGHLPIYLGFMRCLRVTFQIKIVRHFILTDISNQKMGLNFMNQKLTEEKKDLIFSRLCQGRTNKEIAEELQISERSVQRYKKSVKVALETRTSLSSCGEEVAVDYSKTLTKQEKKYVDRIEKEILLYEDSEEGWVYHLSKADLRFKQSGCWWSCIVYPDSAPAGWIDALRAQGFRIAISPLHDKDAWNHDSPATIDPDTNEVIPKGSKYKAGDLKKAHWHVIIVVDKRTSFVEMNDVLQKLTKCPYIQKCRSLRNAYDYFLHINAPEKYQGYDKKAIQVYNNFHVEPTKYEMNLIAMEMVHLIQEHNLLEWCDVVEFFQNDPEFSLILSTRTAYFSAYIKSRYYRTHPVSVKYSEFKYVDQFSFEENEEEKEKSEDE